MPPAKTIYVLGAGASKPSGAPMQAELLPLILDPARDPRTRRLSSYGKFVRHQQEVKAFLERVFRYPREMDVTLEDAMTTIDRALLAKETVRGMPPVQLAEAQRALVACTVEVIAACLERSYLDPAAKAFEERLARFAEARIEAAARREEASSFISLNWDIIMDGALYRAGAGRQAFVDYGSLAYHYDDEMSPYHVGGRLTNTEALSDHGLHGLKLLKLHGSFNWVTCPTCGRLYVKISQKIATDVVRQRTHCEPCGEAVLQPIVVTPSLLKDLGLVHLKMVWHMAALELSQADRLVFLGYSFPQADFEFRYLLAKALPPGTPIDVVLWKTDDPREIAETLRPDALPPPGVPFGKSHLARFKEPPEARYRSFFGDARCTFHYDGVEAYFEAASK